MKHSDVKPLSAEELMGLVYGEEQLPQDRQQHLEQCPLCQQELATCEGLTGRLRTQLYRVLCPASDRLHYYCLDLVPVEERTQIASHLLTCPRCSDEVAVIRQQQAAFEPFPGEEVSLLSVARRLIATLVTPQLHSAVRDLKPPESWPRQYHTETLDISLHLSKGAAGDALLVGILSSSLPLETLDIFEEATVELYPMPASATAEKVELMEFVQPLLATSVDDIGNILLEPIPPGTYVLLIRLPDREILIEGLTIQRL